MEFNQSNIIMAISILIVIAIIILLTAVITADTTKARITEQMIIAGQREESFMLRGKDHVRSYKLIASADLVALRKRAENNNATWDYATINGKAI